MCLGLQKATKAMCGGNWQRKEEGVRVSTLVQATLLLTVIWVPKEMPWK